MSSCEELIELARKLKTEKSFVLNEQKQIQEQFSQLLKIAENVQHRQWIAYQQRLVLSSLIYPNRSDVNVQQKNSLKKLQLLDRISFVDSYKLFQYLQDAPYLRFLTFLRQQPNILAQCLAQTEKVESSISSSTIPILMSSIYNQCLFHDDENFLLELLRSLIEIQLKNDQNPRILLQRSTCSFKILFDAFLTASPSCKLFLTSALHEPIMQMLIDDEFYYDINPETSLNRFSKQERLRKFGQGGVRDDSELIQKYRQVIVNKLYTFTCTFVENLRSSLNFFPSSLSFLISQMFVILSKSANFSASEIRSLCCDLIMTLFIGPAICEPEKHGIVTDIPISHIARHNLNQIAIILQTLAMSNDLESKTKDLYSKFKENCVSSILDGLIDSSANVNLPNRQAQYVSRSLILITVKQLKQLIAFTQRSVTLINDSEAKQQLEIHLKSLTPLEECLKQTPTTQTPEPTADRQNRRTFGSKDVAQQKSERSDSFHLPNEVIVFTLESVENECPGMLPEEKVLQENERAKLLKTASANDFDPSATEKRLRFRLNDNCSVGNISDNLEGLEGISESAASTGNLSVTSSCDDLDKADPLFDNGSVSGRATPNLSGRDTPSSHISLDSSDRRTTSTNNATTNETGVSHQSTTTNGSSTSLVGSVQRGPVLPTTVQKPFRDDVPDKFNLFDLPQQRNTSEAADETRSTISDNWSTMNAGISEIDGQEQVVARLNEIVEELPIIEQRTRNDLLLTETNSLTINPMGKPIDQLSDCWSTEAFASDSETQSEDGLNLQRITNQHQTVVQSTITVDVSDVSSSSRPTTNPMIKVADPVEILLLKSSIENLPSTVENSSSNDNVKHVQSQAASKSPSDNRSVHFPPSDSTSDPNSFVEPTSHLSPNEQNIPKSVRPSERRLTNPISMIKRRFAGNNNNQRRERNSTESEQENLQIKPENISADDILARYSNKNSTIVETNKTSSIIEETPVETVPNENLFDNQIYYDPNNFENCRAFIDAKKKLRVVLSASDVESMISEDFHQNSISFVDFSSNNENSNFLMNFLRSQLYQAIGIQERDLQAQIHETLRSIKLFSVDESKELLRSMIDDYRSRSVYVNYLLKNRETILHSIFHQDRLLLRIQRDQELSKQQVVHYLVKNFLDNKEDSLQKLLERFSHLSIADEKLRLIELFLNNCYREMTSELLAKAASNEQINASHVSIERMVIAKLYTAALYPNGQVDIQRDQVFNGHVRDLIDQVDPNHPKLRIQKIFQGECPWPSAQAELRLINAYKTPRDKVSCVQRCIRIIQNLIRLASNNAAGADDTIPILIYVIIKANPPNLLSIMQYVQDLYATRFTDEESYYWTMFVSGVKFIHEMI